MVYVRSSKKKELRKNDELSIIVRHASAPRYIVPSPDCLFSFIWTYLKIQITICDSWDVFLNEFIIQSIDMANKAKKKKKGKKCITFEGLEGED
jgi:hypothetical protein